VERLRRALRGLDRAEHPALPVGEALHPVTLAAVALLVINDWVIKPSWPGSGLLRTLIAGKLSDVAGLAFAPVVLSAAIGLALAAVARLGVRLDPSLTRRRLLACIAATGAGFVAVKLSPAAAEAVAGALSRLGRPATIVVDRTDLFALPALAIAYAIGRDELRRIPLGKPAAIHRLGRPAGPALSDARWAGADARVLADAADAIDRWDVARIDQLLARAPAALRSRA